MLGLLNLPCSHTRFASPSQVTAAAGVQTFSDNASFCVQVVGRRVFQRQNCDYKARKKLDDWLQLTEPLVLYDAVYGEFAKREKGATAVPTEVLRCALFSPAVHDRIAMQSALSLGQCKLSAGESCMRRANQRPLTAFECLLQVYLQDLGGIACRRRQQPCQNLRGTCQLYVTCIGDCLRQRT
jgi:hypothetical protein